MDKPKRSDYNSDAEYSQALQIWRSKNSDKTIVNNKSNASTSYVSPTSSKQELMPFKKDMPYKDKHTFKQDNRTKVQRKADVKRADDINNASLSPLQRPLVYLANPNKILGDAIDPFVNASETLTKNPFPTSKEDARKIAEINTSNRIGKSGEALDNAFGYVPDAAINTAMGAAFSPTSSMRGILNETLNPLAGGEMAASRKATRKVAKGTRKPTVNKPNTPITSKEANPPRSNTIEAEKALHKKSMEMSVDIGNDFSKIWYNHPSTKRKLKEGGEKFQNRYGDSKLNPFKQISNNINKEDYISSPSWDKRTDIIAGISYSDPVSLNRKNKVFLDNINRLTNNPVQFAKTTSIHEGNHGITTGNTLIPYLYKQDMVKIFGKDSKIPSKNSKGGFDSTDDYIKDPTEIYARIMEVRSRFNLKPGESIDGVKAKQIAETIESGTTPIHSSFGRLITDYNKFANVINYLPAVIGATAATLPNDTNNNDTMKTNNKLKQGGYVTRVPKGIYGALISAGVGIASNLIANGKEDKELERQRNRQMMVSNNAKLQQDTVTASNFDSQGQNLNSFYMAQGGNIPNKLVKPSFDTQGGVLDRKSSNTEEAVGNTHGENSGGVNGIQLSQNGEPKAEIEDDEIVKDGDMVFSDQLKPKGSDETFADIVDKLTTKKGKLEEDMEKSQDGGDLTLRKRNSLKRQIDIINDKEDKLFEEQESIKQEQGIEQPTSTVPSPQNQGQGVPPELQGQQPQPMQEQLPMQPPMQQVQGGQGAPQMPMRKGGNIKKMDGGGRVPYFGGAYQDDQGNNKYEYGGGKFGTNVAPYIDNAANLVNTLTKPKVPKPALTQLPGFKTNVNVSNELNQINQAVGNASDFVSRNSSNSNTARAAIIGTRLKGSQQKNNILSQQKREEQQLENNAKSAQSQIAASNNQTMNAYSGEKLQRDLAVRKEISGNVSNAVEDYGSTVKYNDDVQRDKDKAALYRTIYADGKGSLANRVDLKDPDTVRRLGNNPQELEKIMQGFVDENGNVTKGDKSTIKEYQEFYKKYNGDYFIPNKGKFNAASNALVNTRLY